jgi:hypothetical protein
VINVVVPDLVEYDDVIIDDDDAVNVGMVEGVVVVDRNVGGSSFGIVG